MTPSSDFPNHVLVPFGAEGYVRLWDPALRGLNLLSAINNAIQILGGRGVGSAFLTGLP